MSAQAQPIASRSPTWLDRSLYPFTSRWFETIDGPMHYVDEGAGHPIVLVHGTPTWSFMYRHLVTRLARSHRVIAVDHLGFGLSAKPANAPYEPKDHARRLLALLEALQLTGITLVVHDFGGPIGLAAALARPDRVERLVLFNTWLWSLESDARIAASAKMAASRLGRLLYRHLNFPVRVLMPKAVGDRRVLTATVQRHYAGPLGTPGERMGAWACARALLGASAWYDELWTQRERLRGKPMLLLWGMKDPAFGPAYLERWRTEFPHAEVHTIASCGHFVAEEAHAEAGPPLERFVDEAPARPATVGRAVGEQTV